MLVEVFVKGSDGVVLVPVLSFENIGLFLKNMEENGLREETVKSYKRNLRVLLRFLPKGKKLSRANLEAWVRSMTEEGVCLSTINHRISSCNGYLTFIGRYDLKLSSLPDFSAETAGDELTRNEYLRLLLAARDTGNEQIFQFIRVLGSTGIRVADISKLTIKFLKSDEVYITLSDGKNVRVPYFLKAELLEYAEYNNITSGPVFATSTGNAFDRSYSCRLMTTASQIANIPKYKVTPTTLHKLFLKTYNDTYEQFRPLVDKTYDNFLESEWLNVSRM